MPPTGALFIYQLYFTESHIYKEHLWIVFKLIFERTQGVSSENRGPWLDALKDD